MDSGAREVIRRRIALRERDGHERLLLNHDALRALLDAADERDRLESEANQDRTTPAPANLAFAQFPSHILFH